MSYGDKLSLPQWQKKRLLIMQRDNFRCVKCKRDDIKLEVHHKDYFPDKQPWEYLDADLLTMCTKCHGKEFNREKYENYLILSLRNAGLFADEILALSVFLDKYDAFRLNLRCMIQKAINEGL